MSQTINRMYETLARANNAAWALRHEGFTDVHVCSRGAAGSSTDAIIAALTKGLVLKAHAKVYAEGIQHGASLVTVHAPFGTADAATSVLERHGPIDSGVPEPELDMLLWDEAAPCSSAMRVRVLLDDSMTFSRFWNVKPLVKSGKTTSSALGLPESRGSRGPFSGTFGLPLLSKLMVSSMLGMPLLSKPRTQKR